MQNITTGEMAEVFLIIDIAVIMTRDLYQNMFRKLSV